MDYPKISRISGIVVIALGILSFALEEPASIFAIRLMVLAFMAAVLSESYSGVCSIPGHGIPFKLAASSVLLLIISYELATAKIYLGKLSIWDIVDVLLFIAFILSVGLSGYWVFNARSGRHGKLNLIVGLLGISSACLSLLVVALKAAGI